MKNTDVCLIQDVDKYNYVYVWNSLDAFTGIYMIHSDTVTDTIYAYDYVDNYCYYYYHYDYHVAIFSFVYCDQCFRAIAKCLRLMPELAGKSEV